MLSLDKLSLSVAGLRLCDNLSFNLEAGMCVGVLGLNGSGKTSLIHTLAGFVPPDTGRVLLNDVSIDKMSVKSRAQKIACLLQAQEFNFPFSVFDTVALAKYSDLTRFEVLSAEDLQIIKNILEWTGLEHKKNQDVMSLSGGEKQRLAFASILVQDPAIFLLDEPSNNLDLSYFSLIENIAKDSQKASIMVLHDLQLADKICSHILLLKDGEFLFGKKSEILNTKNLQWVYEIEFKQVLAEGHRFFL